MHDLVNDLVDGGGCATTVRDKDHLPRVLDELDVIWDVRRGYGRGRQIGENRLAQMAEMIVSIVLTYITKSDVTFTTGTTTYDLGTGHMYLRGRRHRSPVWPKSLSFGLRLYLLPVDPAMTDHAAMAVGSESALLALVDLALSGSLFW